MEFEKYHKIRQLGDQENQEIFTDAEDEIIIEEKIDGGNFRFMITQNQIFFGSRSRDITEDDNKQFKRCIEYVREKLLTYVDTQPNGLTEFEGLLFYGECCTRHTMAYDWDNMPPYLGFDIKQQRTASDDTEYLDYTTKQDIFERLDLPMVPLIKRCKASEITEVNDDMVPISAYPSPSSKDQKAEGIVFKNYDKQLFAKYVRDAFKERNSEAFGGSPKYNKDGYSDNNILVHKYCTNPRIDKMIFKLIDEGFALEMKLMEHLPKRVYADIAEEEWMDIINSRWIIDFNSLKKLMTKRCVAVLKQVITNNALEKKE